MMVKFERLPVDNQEKNALLLPNDQLMAIEKDYLAAPLKSGGSFGPISWDMDFHIDFADISKSYAYIDVFVIGFKVISGRLDVHNPKLSADLTVGGVGVKAEVGIDFNRRVVYFKGNLNFIFYATDYDFPIWSF